MEEKQVVMHKKQKKKNRKLAQIKHGRQNCVKYVVFVQTNVMEEDDWVPLEEKTVVD